MRPPLRPNDPTHIDSTENAVSRRVEAGKQEQDGRSRQVHPDVDECIQPFPCRFRPFFRADAIQRHLDGPPEMSIIARRGILTVLLVGGVVNGVGGQSSKSQSGGRELPSGT